MTALIELFRFVLFDRGSFKAGTAVYRQSDALRALYQVAGGGGGGGSGGGSGIGAAAAAAVA